MLENPVYLFSTDSLKVFNDREYMDHIIELKSNDVMRTRFLMWKTAENIWDSNNRGYMKVIIKKRYSETMCFLMLLDRLWDKTVYVVGLQQVGGCWNWNGNYYSTYEDAMLARNAEEEKVFLYRLSEPRIGKLELKRLADLKSQEAV